jgi:hypothetical protein
MKRWPAAGRPSQGSRGHGCLSRAEMIRFGVAYCGFASVELLHELIRLPRAHRGRCSSSPAHVSLTQAASTTNTGDRGRALAREMPCRPALLRTAETDRFNDFAIVSTGASACASARSVRNSSFDQEAIAAGRNVFRLVMSKANGRNELRTVVHRGSISPMTFSHASHSGKACNCTRTRPDSSAGPWRPRRARHGTRLRRTR